MRAAALKLELYLHGFPYVHSRGAEHCAARYRSIGMEISRQMGEDELRKAFKKASLKLHPDRNGGKSDAEKKLLEALSRCWRCIWGRTCPD